MLFKLCIFVKVVKYECVNLMKGFTSVTVQPLALRALLVK